MIERQQTSIQRQAGTLMEQARTIAQMQKQINDLTDVVQQQYLAIAGLHNVADSGSQSSVADKVEAAATGAVQSPAGISVSASTCAASMSIAVAPARPLSLLVCVNAKKRGSFIQQTFPQSSYEVADEREGRGGVTRVEITVAEHPLHLTSQVSGRVGKVKVELSTDFAQRV
jgi:hypothetical protein